MSYICKKVESKKEMSDFIDLPFRLYENHEYWVPPLRMEQRQLFNRKKNPYFKHSAVSLFNVYKGREIVGRISAQTNSQHNKWHNDKVGFFGFFECINDPEPAALLFENAEQFLRENGCDMIRGPMNFSVNQECGLLVDGFDSLPFIMMPYNYQYYEKIILYSGFKKAKDLLAYYLKQDYIPDRIERIAKISEKRGNFEIRSLSKNKKQLKKDIEEVFTVYTNAWEKNWGFVPMTREEFDYTVKSLMVAVDPDIVFLATVKGEPVGFSLALPDLNIALKKMKGRIFPLGLLKFLLSKRHINRLRVMAMGVVKEHQRKGIDGLFYYHTFKNGLAKGYNEGEFSWILEDNVEMNNIARKLGAKVHKTYRVMEKKII